MDKVMKAAWLKSLSVVLAALLGLAGVVLGILAQNTSDANQGDLERVLQQIDDRMIPMIESNLQSLQRDVGILARTVDDLRDRVKMMEAKIKIATIPETPRSRALSGALAKLNSPQSNPVKLPRVQQQQVLPGGGRGTVLGISAP